MDGKGTRREGKGVELCKKERNVVGKERKGGNGKEERVTKG